MKMLPKARTTEIVVQTFDKELLIYDLLKHRAFRLNETSMIVFNACDGATTIDELKAQYKYTDEIIYLALDGLKKENLIVDEYASPFAGMNRREVIRRVGLASMIALPVILAMVAPQAADAASGCNTQRGGCLAVGDTFSDNSQAGSFSICTDYCTNQGQTTCCSCQARNETFSINNFCVCQCF